MTAPYVPPPMRRGNVVSMMDSRLKREQDDENPSPHWRGEGERSPGALARNPALSRHPKGSSGLIRIQRINNEKLLLAKHFRQHMTYAERCFWNIVRKNQFNGLRFRRQQVIHGFIADFFCNQVNLVVEVDGGIHETQKDYDKLRDYIISACGIKVIRFTNDEVIDHSDRVEQRLTQAAGL